MNFAPEEKCARNVSVCLSAVSAIQTPEIQTNSVPPGRFARTASACPRDVTVTQTQRTPTVCVRTTCSALSANVSHPGAPVTPPPQTPVPVGSSAPSASVSLLAVTVTHLASVSVSPARFARTVCASPPWPLAVIVTLALKIQMHSVLLSRGVFPAVSACSALNLINWGMHPTQSPAL
jgi:hypothetical protein